MSISGLQLGHVNLRARSLETTIGFYERALGLRRRASDTNPDTSVNLWLTDNAGRPCIHVNQLLNGETRVAQGSIDHFAFDCTDRTAMEAHLTALGIAFDIVPFPAARMVQLNLRDPDGVKVEITCRETP